MKRQHVLFGFAFLLVTLVTAHTQGAVRSNAENRQIKAGKGIVFVNRGEFMRLAKQPGVTIRTIRLSKRDLAKLASSGPKGCGCLTVPEELEEFGFGGCFRDCITKFSSTTALAICGGACVASGTGNPVAIGICAACLGIEEWIVAGCAAKCVWFSTKNVVPKIPRNLRRSQTHDENSAKLLLNQTPSVSMR